MKHILTLLLLLSFTSAQAQDAKPADLFNGKDLTGWSGVDGFWKVENGTIIGQTTKEKPTKGNTFLIWQGGEISDFDFSCEVKFEGNNSGVQYRSKIVDKDKHVLAGYQADLHPKQDFFGMMYGEKMGKRGIIIKRGQKMVIGADGKKEVTGKVGDGAELKGTDWNTMRILAVGNRLIHQINGVTTIDLTDDDPMKCTSGSLGLQLHGGAPMKVEFKNLKLQKIDADTGAKKLKAISK